MIERTKNRLNEPRFAPFFTVVFAIFASVASMCASATLIIEGDTEEEKKEINKAIEDFAAKSAKAKAIVNSLKAPEAGNVTVKFGPTIDVATATRPPQKVITLNKDAISAMTQVGEGKALEQFSLPYLFGHEGLHILEPTWSEDQVVTRINEVRVDAKSSKRKQYKAVISDRKTYLEFDDGSKVDVTEALRIGEGRDKRPIAHTAKGIALSAAVDSNGEMVMQLDGAQTMKLFLTDELGGGEVDVELQSLYARLLGATSTKDPEHDSEHGSEHNDFTLTVQDFELVFASFEINGKNTGMNTIKPYLAHQNPYGYWDWAADGSFNFDFSGDLGWYNDLFSKDGGSIAIEQLSGEMTYYAGDDGWTGSGNLVGIKFAAIPEPSTLLLLAVATAGLALTRRRRTSNECLGKH